MAFVISKTCYKCAGTGIWVKTTVTGEVPIDPCPVCQGSGMLPMYSVELGELENKVNNLSKTLKDVENVCEKILKIIDKQG